MYFYLHVSFILWLRIGHNFLLFSLLYNLSCSLQLFLISEPSGFFLMEVPIRVMLSRIQPILE